VIEDESQIGKNTPEMDQKQQQELMRSMQKKKEAELEELERRDGSNLVRTRSGKGYKPGGQYLRSDTDSQQYDGRNVNMGDFQRKEDNPFSKLVNFAKGDWNDKK
jgi:hypothetical protein